MRRRPAAEEAPRPKPNRRRLKEPIGTMMLAQPLDDALDAGPRKTAHGAERLCAATGTVRPVDDMIRFVAVAGGHRGSRSEAAACPAAASGSRRPAPRSATRSRARHLRAASSATCGSRRIWSSRPNGLLERAALDALAIAYKAGRVAAGFAKVEAALVHGNAIALLHAVRCRPRRGAKAQLPRCAGTVTAGPSRFSMHSPRRNWIWHWAGQMWYMLRCLPAPKARRF